MRPKGTITILPILAALLLTAPCAYAVDLTVGSSDGNAVGDTIAIPITASDATGIAGAAFTVQYNTTDLEVTAVDSDFFDTFQNQFAGTPAALTTTVDVDGVTYDQPLVTNPVDEVGLTGMRIAAARALAAADLSNSTLFTLSVRILNAGSHPMGITATTIQNAAAGYDTPTEIPYLIGALADEPDLTQAFPEIAVTARNVGTIAADGGDPDTDGDGLPDSVETNTGVYVSSTDTGTDPSNSDSDGDGYSDGEEVDAGDDPNDPNSTPPVTVDLILVAGWNLISLPVTPADATLTTLFPDASVAYEFDGAYASVTALEPGPGYWVKVTNGGTYSITGSSFNVYSGDLTAGWHLLGGVDGTVTPATDPVGSISVMYGFAGAYASTTEMEAGGGYWVKITATCQFSLDGLDAQ